MTSRWDSTSCKYCDPPFRDLFLKKVGRAMNLCPVKRNLNENIEIRTRFTTEEMPACKQMRREHPS